MATINMHMKFEIEIPKQTWLMLRKPCHLQTDRRTDGQMDRRTDGQGESSIPPPPTSLGGGYKNHIIINFMHAPAAMELKLRRYRNADVLHTNDVWDAFY